MIKKLFSVELDLRSLAALRIGLGLLVMLDALLRSRDLRVFYTDTGVLPRATLLEVPHPTLFSLFNSAGTAWGAGFWLLALALSGVGMLVGWQTRWCTLAAWILHTAVKARNPFICHAGDLELGLILWWAIFLPTSARYSWSSKAHPEWATLKNSYSSVATFGYQLQISLIYLMAFLHKLDPVWTESGLALYYTLSYDIFATSLGQVVGQHWNALRYLSYATVLIELAVPVLLWLPWKRRNSRAVALVLLHLFHLSIALTLHLGLMVAVNLICLAGLWPAFLFPKVSEKEAPSRSSDCPNIRLHTAAVVLLSLICIHNVYFNYSYYRGQVIPKIFKQAAYPFRQQQSWDLFAPHPGTEDGWVVAVGECINGKRIDLLRHGATPDFEKPESVPSLFPNHRWRMWLMRLVDRRDPRVHRSFCHYLVSQWNQARPEAEKVKRVELIFVSELTPLPDQVPKLKKVPIFELEVPVFLYKNPSEVYLPISYPDKWSGGSSNEGKRF